MIRTGKPSSKKKHDSRNNNNTQQQPKKHERNFVVLTPRTVETVLVGAVCFYVGLLIGTGRNLPACGHDGLERQLRNHPSLQEAEAINQTTTEAYNTNDRSGERISMHQHHRRTRLPFPSTSRNMFLDFATVPRDSFTDHLDLGVPLDDTLQGAEDVLVLYATKHSLPNGLGLRYDKVGIDADQALENCRQAKIILHQPSQWNSKQPSTCLAIVPQWESYTVHKWMRVAPAANTSNATLADPSTLHPLRYVARGQQLVDDGTKPVWMPPEPEKTRQSNRLLVEYLQHVENATKDLQQFLEDTLRQARDPSLRALAVMTCNQGQSELFRNFVCNARAKNLDLSHVVLFATDEATFQLSNELGIRAWYNADIFGSIPQSAAGRYGDKVFSKVMMAKVYCMHLALTSTEYDILFQDADMIWNRDPLPLLATSKEFKDWDMIFQDDGARMWRYAPYAPNSGFYFVRNNLVTNYFFEKLVRSGDMIQQTTSQQHVLNDLLIEFSSSQGLRVKVVTKGDDNVFAGGVEFHNKQEYMKEMMRGTRIPCVFHMSWTLNKDDKQKFLEQLGEWYARDSKDGCHGMDCCLAEPNITCHYRDKPSKIPCPDSPMADERHGQSFW